MGAQVGGGRSGAPDLAQHAQPVFAQHLSNAGLRPAAAFHGRRQATPFAMGREPDGHSWWLGAARRHQAGVALVVDQVVEPLVRLILGKIRPNAVRLN